MFQKKFCAVCGKEIPRAASRYSARIYCSEFCRQNALYEKTCPTCGKTFLSKRGDKKYCSVRCRKITNRRKKTCAFCGKEFFTSYSGRKYCSSACTAKAHYHRHRKAIREKYNAKRRKTYKKVCAFCGKEFETHDSKRRFCSNECYRRYYLKEHVEMEKTCPTCGKVFVTTRPCRKYCSIPCRSKSYYKKKIFADLPIDAKPLCTKKLGENTCPVCGDIFISVSPNQKYCSKECQQAAQYGKNPEGRKIGRRQKKCPVCGKIFTKDPANHRTIYCSDACRNFNPKKKPADPNKKTILDWQKEAAACGLSYGQYRMEIERFGKTFDELRLKHIEEKLLRE